MVLIIVLLKQKVHTYLKSIIDTECPFSTNDFYFLKKRQINNLEMLYLIETHRLIILLLIGHQDMTRSQADIVNVFHET